MKSAQLLTMLFIFIFVTTKAQKEPFYKSYDWEKNPNYNIAFNDSVEIVSLKDNVITEFFYESDGSLSEYFLIHQVYWLNSDEEIEKNNKIYIPYSSSTTPLINKGRVITNGKIIELKDSEILTAQDEETKKTYKYYTFTGVEKGSIIEYLYLLKKVPNYKGNSIYFQDEHLSLNSSLHLYAPVNLHFKFKSYNNLPDVIQDTTIEDKLHWSVSIDSIPSLEKEILSAYNTNRMFLIYKLDKNTATNQHDISSYGIVSDNIYKYITKEESKSTIKELNKVIKEAKINPSSTTEQQIRKLEDHIKRNYFYINSSATELSDVSYILKNKLGNEDGLLKIYSKLFQILNIDFQIVLTSDKTSIRFDKDFEANNFLTDYLFYFPKIDSYLSHTELNSRLGYPPPELTNNYGLFIKEVALGDYKTGIGKINFIKPISREKTFDKILIDVKFDLADMTTITADLTKSNQGYYASFHQPYMHLLDEKNRNEVIDGQIKYLGEDVEILEKNVINDNPEAYGIKPFQVNAKIKLNSSIEKAGDKYLFKIGDLIGPQMEMYQNKKRVLPLETGFNRTYYREITFTIPDNYLINNLNDLTINNSFTDKGEVIFNFSSKYELIGQKVKVIIEESYAIFEIIPELFEEYRRVINSAADFNKITLIMEPK